MARKKKRSRQPIAAAKQLPNEERGVVALTVFWMLTLLATFFAELLALGTGLCRTWLEKISPMLGMVPGLMFFVALVAGACCVALTPLTRRLRKSPPPQAISRTALIVGALPWVVGGVSAIVGWLR